MEQKRKDNRGRTLRNGEAQRADGKYMFRYTDLDGVRQTIYSWRLVATDKLPSGKRADIPLREAEKQIAKDLGDGMSAKKQNETINTLFDRFMDVRIDLRTSTRCNYLILYDTHVRNTLGRKAVGRVAYSDVQRFYVGLSKGGLGYSTIQKINAVLSQIFQRAVMDNTIRTNPADNALRILRNLPGTEPDKRRALTVEEQGRLIDYIYRERRYQKWGTLFTVLLGTGMRIGEALGLRWCDCDFDNNTINVNHALLYKPDESGKYGYRISEPKTKAGYRGIPMFQDVRNALLKEKENAKQYESPFSVDGYTGFIFLNSHGKVFTPGTVFDTIQDIVNDYNRQELAVATQEGREPCYIPRISAHILRHTFCTRLCENIADIKVIQDAMGHKNAQTTMNIYNDVTEMRKLDQFREIDGKIKLV